MCLLKQKYSPLVFINIHILKLCLILRGGSYKTPLCTLYDENHVDNDDHHADDDHHHVNDNDEVDIDAFYSFNQWCILPLSEKPLI